MSMSAQQAGRRLSGPPAENEALGGGSFVLLAIPQSLTTRAAPPCHSEEAAADEESRCVTSRLAVSGRTGNGSSTGNGIPRFTRNDSRRAAVC